mmetsp:Transcript_105062/g.263140  ORF Transcript_105062/g.263140 Transcript_105062/m.263140 type:complete len:260 (+) Transcript_105062:2294-3073(+)
MVRSPGSGRGSSQGLFMSFGMASSKLCCMASLASRRSFASVVCVDAARAKLPSGSLTTWIGDNCSPAFVVWPRKKTGSRSCSSISKSSSMSLSPKRPRSASQSSRSWLSSTPEWCNCCASHISYSDNFFFCRNLLREVSLSAKSSLIPVILPTAGSSSFFLLRIGFDAPLSSSPSSAFLPRGFRSSPVSWSTSRMDMFNFDPAIPMILTNTSWLRLTQSAARETFRVSLVSSVKWQRPSLRPSDVSTDKKAPYSITRET